MMNTPLSFLLAVSFATASATVRAQDPAPPVDTMGELSRSAESQLDASIQELNRLREQITAEKFPMAQELTHSEESVTELRREQERVSRQVDSGALEVAAIQADIKSHQQELDYVATLLDEYARSFESKVNVSELQACSKTIEAAKQVTEDTTLTPSEKFLRQVAVVELSTKRLIQAVGGMRFPGTGVDLQGTVAQGQFLLLGPIALFASKSGVAGLVVPQTGSTQPLIRPLEGAIQTGIAALVESGEGIVPLDPSRGGALKALVQRTNLIHIFEKGGPIMWPLLIASILALGTVIERVLFILNEQRKRDRKALDLFFHDVERGNTVGAIRTSRASKDFVVRALGYALEHRETSLASALLYAQSLELKRFRRGIPILDTVITLAPLLGLLGTVVGMMGSFSLIGGELSSPGAITGGIAEALIATAFGLGIAITSLLPFNYLNTKLDDASQEMESAAAQLELLTHPDAKAAHSAA